MHPAETLFHAGDAHEHDEDVPAADAASSSDEKDTVFVSPPATPLEKRKSHDSFASAASEIIASTPASPTPTTTFPPPIPARAAVPVPESPVVASPATPTTATTIVVGSPPSTPTRPDAPVRNGSPAPPPLPRRAAARARPSSLVPAPATSLAHIPDAATETVKEASVLVEENITTNSPTSTTETTSPSEPQRTPEAIVELEKPIAATSTNDMETSASAADIPPSPTPTILPMQPVEPTSDTTTTARDVGEMASEGFIGETTWEDKTWRELVKLKEDMFWARVGGAYDGSMSLGHDGAPAILTMYTVINDKREFNQVHGQAQTLNDINPR
ncbi:hypothetical protein HWV62_22064 [Athelia sp. TMB]|nr:hypothetical protein HWV62_22064 [Athelia sp. TMB]